MPFFSVAGAAWNMPSRWGGHRSDADVQTARHGAQRHPSALLPGRGALSLGEEGCAGGAACAEGTPQTLGWGPRQTRAPRCARAGRGLAVSHGRSFFPPAVLTRHLGAAQLAAPGLRLAGEQSLAGFGRGTSSVTGSGCRCH